MQTTSTVGIDFPQTCNRYAYVDRTPLVAADPLGLCFDLACKDTQVSVTSAYQEVPTISAPIPTSLPMPTSAAISNQLAMFIADAMSPQPSKAAQGYCVTENTPINADWRSPNGNLSGDLDAADGPYDPDPMDDGCATSRSGGGTAGPTIGPAQSPVPVKPGMLDCASAFAAKWSIAGALHAMGVSDGGGAGEAITNALGGNAVSGIVDSVRHFSLSPADLLLGGTHQGLPGEGLQQKGIGGAVTDGIPGRFWSTVTGAGQTLQTLSGEVSLASTGTTTAEFVSGAGWVKLLYDAGAYGVGIAACGMH